jgi:hypothetical protein
MASRGLTVAPAPAAEAGGALPEHFFELYKLAVEMADRISARRAVANSFFLTVNTALAALVGSGTFRWYVAAAGMVVAASWWAVLRSYRELNAAKFRVILAMEERLPVKLFGEEWVHLDADGIAGRGAGVRVWAGRYRGLGRVEQVVPWVFVAFYGVELLRPFVT